MKAELTKSNAGSMGVLDPASPVSTLGHDGTSARQQSAEASSDMAAAASAGVNGMVSFMNAAGITGSSLAEITQQLTAEHHPDSTELTGAGIHQIPQHEDPSTRIEETPDGLPKLIWFVQQGGMTGLVDVLKMEATVDKDGKVKTHSIYMDGQ